MTIKNWRCIGFFSLLFFLTSCAPSLVYTTIKDSSACTVKKGYWYKNKCWKEFDDDGISKSKIDSVVTVEMKIIEKSTFRIAAETLPLVGFLPIEDDNKILLIAVYGTENHYKSLIFPTGKKKMEKGVFESPTLLFDGDALSGNLDKASKLMGSATVNVIDLDNLDIEISGKITDKANSTTKDFAFEANEAILGAGNSNIEIKGNEAYLSGDLGTLTYWQIKNLIEEHPKVQTIVMTTISGSLNDAVNMHTGRILHENGFTTKVLSTSDIASGGVDLFCAGKRRIIEQGAKIGVHSWCCVNDLTAGEIPKEHPAHQYQLEYFTMALGAENGPAFYFYTLEASPFEGVHYMTDEEIKEWGIATEFIEKK